MTTRACGLAFLLYSFFCVAPTSADAQTVEYYHADAIGSVRIVTDAAGALLREHDYWPFGVEVNPPIPDCVNPNDPRGFTGQQRDKETCQDYFGARYYRFSVGRFTSVDPVLDIEGAIEDPQRWNRYSYVANNPLTLIDPDGREIVAVNPKTGKFYGAGTEVLNAAPSRDRLLTPIHDLASLGIPMPPLGIGMLRSPVAIVRASETLSAAARIAANAEKGRVGEESVRLLYNIGDRIKTAIKLGDRTRVPDGINEALGTLSEVKNVSGVMRFTAQLRDFANYAKEKALRFDLYLPTGTKISKELNDAVTQGLVNIIRYVPKG